MPLFAEDCLRILLRSGISADAAAVDFNSGRQVDELPHMRIGARAMYKYQQTVVFGTATTL